ncbi:MAG: hypothetical protein ACO1SX_02320 [Actinomycetota bacterium]
MDTQLPFVSSMVCHDYSVDPETLLATITGVNDGINLPVMNSVAPDEPVTAALTKCKLFVMLTDGPPNGTVRFEIWVRHPNNSALISLGAAEVGFGELGVHRHAYPLDNCHVSTSGVYTFIVTINQLEVSSVPFRVSILRGIPGD